MPPTSIHAHQGCSDGECFQEVHVEGQANTVCVKIDSENCNGVNDPTLPPADCQGSYLQTQGYRRVPGDQCEGGDELLYEKVRMPCSGVVTTSSVTPTPAPASPSVSISSQRSVSASLTPKAPSETASPTVSIKGPIDASPTTSPVATAAASPSMEPSTTTQVSLSPSQTIPPPKSGSPSPSATMTLKASPTQVADNSSEDGSESGEPSNTPWIIYGSVVAGVVAVLFILCIGILFVLIR